MKTNIEQSIEILKAGGIVAFPTETVYGLGADARNENAIRKVFMVKGRPIDHPLIVHLAHVDQLEKWATDIPEKAILLAKHFWPGPLTLVLLKKASVSNLITGNQNTIALRIPKHPLTLTMLQQFGSGIVGPSANTYGRISPTSAIHVKNDLGEKVDYILDGGPCEIGIESTIVYFTNNEPHILRQGHITKEDIAKVLGTKFSNTEDKKTCIRVPGLAKVHYAPLKPLFLVQSEDLQSIANFIHIKCLKYSCLSFQSHSIENIIWHQAPQQAALYAKNLYSLLHQLDTENTKGIILEMPPSQPSWAAIIDRLNRASTGVITLENISKLVI